MATADNGTSITNFEASPRKFNDKILYLARPHVITEVVDVAGADDDGDVLLICPVHSSWAISDIEIMNDAISSGTDYDLGLYATTADGGAVVDVNAYGDAIDMSSARVAWTSVGYEIRGIEKAGQRVWQDAGVSADPDGWYYLALTGVTIGSGAGDIAVRVTVLDGT